jgi:hypothetical protein
MKRFSNIRFAMSQQTFTVNIFSNAENPLVIGLIKWHTYLNFSVKFKFLQEILGIMTTSKIISWSQQTIYECKNDKETWNRLFS